jgi:hypothetical protein
VGDGYNFGEQIAIGTQNAGLAGRMWTRSQNNGTWTGWVEKANKSDMFWSGANTGGDCNAATAPGCYSGNWTANKPTTGNSYGSLLVLASDIATGYRQQIFIRENDNRMWFRASNALPWQEIPKPATIGTYPQSIAVNSVQPGGPYLVSLTSSPINPILPSDTVSFNILGLTGFTANDIGKAWTLFVSYPYMQDYKDVVVSFQDYSGESMNVRLHSYVPLGTYNVKQSVILTCLGIRGSTPFFAWT